MPVDLNKLLPPVLDMLAKSGELTTEWKAAKASGRIALVLFVLGILGLLAGCVGDAFGATSKVGIIAGGLATLVGVATQIMSQLGYTASRTAVKAQAQALATTIVKAPAAELAAAPMQLVSSTALAPAAAAGG